MNEARANTVADFANLGRALRWIRSERRLRQRDVAQRAGITRPMLSAYETAKQRPSLETLGRVLQALNTDLVELIETMTLFEQSQCGEVAPKPVPVSRTTDSLLQADPAMWRRLGVDPASSEGQAFVQLIGKYLGWMLELRRVATSEPESVQQW